LVVGWIKHFQGSTTSFEPTKKNENVLLKAFVLENL